MTQCPYCYTWLGRSAAANHQCPNDPDSGALSEDEEFERRERGR